MTAIEWTDVTWNPIVGCSPVSEGCRNCFAKGTAHRKMSPQHRGLTVLRKSGVQWNGRVRLVERRLALPLTWKRGRRVFVNSMSDLFHEGFCPEDIARVFAPMAIASQHTFQVLTKRAKRAREILSNPTFWLDVQLFVGADLERMSIAAGGRLLHDLAARQLSNVHLLVSVEDQATAEERIPELLRTPAAVRGVSYEPAIGPVDFAPLWCERHGSEHVRAEAPAQPWCVECDSEVGHAEWLDSDAIGGRHLDWIIVGGESGAGARPFDIAWARSTIAQCRSAGVPVFCKQLGAHPVEALSGPWASPPRLLLADRKGGTMDQWPPDLRVREFPKVPT